MAEPIQGEITLSPLGFKCSADYERAVWGELSRRGVPVFHLISSSRVARGRLYLRRDILTDALIFKWTEQ